MKKNVLRNTALLACLVLAALLLMHLLPALEVGGHRMRRVDLLSDVRRLAPPVDEPDSLLPPPPKVKPAFVDSCPPGMTCIEDYGDSTHRGMEAFYRALDEAGNRPVRIAYFGDSFIEGDIFTADLRHLLQERYGGCGVGYVDITSQTYGFRPTVRHAFDGWQSHAWTDSLGFDAKLQGMAGRYFLPRPGAYVELRGQKDYAAHLDTCREATLFFLSSQTVELAVSRNRGAAQTQTFAPSAHVQTARVEGRIGQVRWTVQQADSAVFYGLSMDGDQGIVLDNLSLRGSTGLSIRSIPQERLSDFNRLRPYDLIVLQYGLNIATERGKNYDRYAAGMNTTIGHLKAAFPQASILLVGVGDRDYKDEDGNLRTMPGIRNLVRYQQNLAADNGIAFWNLFEAMGGNLSMAGLVEAQPPMANKDYTHINFRGGEHLAGLLYEALVHGKKEYDRRRAYEAE